MENGESQNGDQWLPVSDMMSGLMMVFLFLAITYMINITKEKDKIKEIAVTYNKLQKDLYQDLHAEFQDDLANWDAEIDSVALSVRFKSPDILFDQGSANLKQKFKSILKDFFPRFLKIITSEKYINDIDEVRIEGHTSSLGQRGMDLEESYLYNMNLSQRRSFETISYLFVNHIPLDLKDWSIERITANGLSYSKRRYLDDGNEDRNLSRRVEFRIKTNAEDRIVKIISE